VWAHSVGVGQRVVAGTTILICEVMKCEFPVETDQEGIVSWLAPCGQIIEAGDIIAMIDD
jgi:biotin carboxyl carrier protein